MFLASISLVATLAALVRAVRIAGPASYPRPLAFVDNWIDAAVPGKWDSRFGGTAGLALHQSGAVDKIDCFVVQSRAAWIFAPFILENLEAEDPIFFSRLFEGPSPLSLN